MPAEADRAATTPPVPTAPTGGDRARQITVTLAEVFCVLGTLVGTGVIGTRVQESSGGALAADATGLAPAGPAFSIWSVIYAGLLAYTLWQWLPAQAAAPRQRAIGWLVAASMVLNASWLLVTQVDAIAWSVVVIVALVSVLAALMIRLHATPCGGTAERVVVDGTFGLYLGWVCVAVCANVAAALAAGGWRPEGVLADVLGVAVVAVAAGIGVLLARRLGGRWAVAAAIAWGLSWIAVGRLSDEPRSTPIAVAAVLGALVVLAGTFRARRPSATRAA